MASHALTPTLVCCGWTTDEQQRKKRFKADKFASEEHVPKYECQKVHSGMHNSRSKAILAVCVHPTQPNVVLTAGQDKTALVYDLNTMETLTTYKVQDQACCTTPAQHNTAWRSNTARHNTQT